MGLVSPADRTDRFRSCTIGEPPQLTLLAGERVIMTGMNPPDVPIELTPEQQRALDARGGVVEGDSFVLMHKDVILDFFGYSSRADLLGKLKPAFDQADRGELHGWDVDVFLSRMRRSRSDESD